MNGTAAVDPTGVFINAPFDRRYEPLFVTLVGVLTFIEYKPHCVLEVRETGEGRLQRIYELMRTCRISIHDLSRIGAPARFNMPFELGLACSLKLGNPREYEVIVLDSEPYRMDRRLSDFKGRDLFIHHGTCDGMVAAILDSFQSRGVNVPAFRRALRELRRSTADMKADFRAATIFHPHLFTGLMEAITQVAARHGLLLP
ncbi:MAG TPA: hypothetical protein VG323_18185 [Thermoanaerobaculia bacterium]|nr:hypothetical protein [Thermoanaerobaculia bacterium]